MSISAVIITLNEEVHIERCLKSLQFADEIVVLDSYSTDRTVEIARKYTDKVSFREFRGFGEQKAAALDLASCEWLLFVDADEVVSEGMASEICEVIEHGSCDGYRSPRLTYFLGRAMRYCGWYPDYQLRLAKKCKARMPERLVHEHLEVDGIIGTLRSPLIHYSYANMAVYTRKMFHYARAAAEQKQREGRKSRLSDLLFRPCFTFVKMYLLKQGFRDGLHGFILSGLSASSVFLRYVMLWDMSRSANPAKEQKYHD